MRVAPLTMSLAIIESKLPETVSPWRTPASTRTPGPPGTLNADEAAGRGHESVDGVLAVDAELERVAAHLGVEVGDRLARRDAELLAHQVHARDLFGDGVLDLQASVDLEEADGAVRADQELARSRADVAGLAQDRLARLDEARVLVVREERRGRLLDELLVTTLEGAVARRDDDDVAVGVGEALGLDVPRLVEEALDEALAATEGRDGLARGGVEKLGDVLAVARDLEAATSAAEGGLDGDGEAEAPRRRRSPRRRSRRGPRCRAPAGRPRRRRCGGRSPCRRAT